MRILITGVNGFLGSALSLELRNRGHIVFGMDLSHGENEHAFTMGFSVDGDYFKGDVGEYRQINRIIRYVKPDIIYHCAAEFGRWNGEDFYETAWKSNVIGTKNILDIQSDLGFKLVHFSSSEVYGDLASTMFEKPIEQIGCLPMNDYAITKWTNEAQIRNSKRFKDCCILRFFNVYGPGELYSPYRSVICRMVYCGLMGIRFKVFRGHSRSNTYVTDAIEAVANLSDPQMPSDQFNRVFNIGSTEETSIEEIASIVQDSVGKECNFEFVDCEPDTVKRKMVDNTNTVTHLSFLQKVSIDEGIRNTVNWMRAGQARK